MACHVIPSDERKLRNHGLVPLLTAPLVVAVLMLSVTPVSARPAMSSPHHLATSTTTTGVGYIVVNPSKKVTRGDATFYPTGPLSADTLVVIANQDGSLPNGLTLTSLKTMVAKIRAQRAAAHGPTVQSSAKLVSATGGTYYSYSATAAN